MMGWMPCMPMNRRPTSGRRVVRSTCPMEPPTDRELGELEMSIGWTGPLLVSLVVMGLLVFIITIGGLGPLWIGLAFALLVVLGGVVLLARAGHASIGARAASPEQALRVRFARGEITRKQYQDALVKLFQDRYVRGDLDLAAYEARVSQVLVGPRS